MLGNVSCGRPGAVGSMVLWNVLTLTLRLFTLRVDSDARPGAHDAVVVVLAALPLRGRADRAIELRRAGVVDVLAGIAERHAVVGAREPVGAKLSEQIVGRRRGERLRDRLRRVVARADQHGAVLVAIFDGAEAEERALPDRPADGCRELLAVEREVAAGAAGRRWRAATAASSRASRSRRTHAAVSPPERVTTLMTDPADRPSSAENRLVAIWNSWTLSCAMFISGPPTTSSLLSMPSMVTLPPRPNWPADEISTELVLVGSKFGAGVLPGTSSASSRKLRPLSGSLSMAASAMTASTTDRVVLTMSSAGAGDADRLLDAGDRQCDRQVQGLADAQRTSV